MLRRPRLLGEGRQPSQEIQRLASSSNSLQIGGIEAVAIASADLSLDKECILERSRVVSTAPKRMPYIGLHGKYNKRWYVDIVALPHNAARTFLSFGFELLSAVHRLVLDMTKADFDLVFAFFAQLDTFIRVLLDAEDKILYPEVESGIRKLPDSERHALHPSIRLQTKAAICLTSAALTANSLHVTPSVQVANILQVTLDSLSSQLLDYFACKEAELPRIFSRSIRGAKEKTRMEGRLIKYFEDLNNEYFYTALLISPLALPEVRSDFEERHFSKGKKGNFRKAVTEIEQTLFAIPKLYDEAASIYESRFGMDAFLENYGRDRDGDMTTQLIK